MPADSADVQRLMLVSHLYRVPPLRYFVAGSLRVLLSASSRRIKRSILKGTCQCQPLAPGNLVLNKLSKALIHLYLRSIMFQFNLLIYGKLDEKTALLGQFWCQLLAPITSIKFVLHNPPRWLLYSFHV